MKGLPQCRRKRTIRSPYDRPPARFLRQLLPQRSAQKFPPKAPSNFRAIVTEELLAFWSFLTSNWLYILPGIALLIALLYVVRPLPPRSLTIATGQAHSTADVIGQKYRSFFQSHGVDLRLVPTLGAEENLQLLSEGKVDAAFGQGGLPLGSQADHVLSLGSIAYQPLWLFIMAPR